MTYRPFIASYQKDFPWLRACLASLRLHAKGFLPPAVCTDIKDAPGARQVCAQVCPEAIVVIKDGPHGKGMSRAMISMMSCDLLCKADNYLLIGSDCLILREMAPEIYCHAGKPLMLWNTYAELGFPGTNLWQKGTETALGMKVENEYMRRLPLFYPRELFEPFRRHIEAVQKRPFEQYIYTSRNISESNLMGAFAHRFMPELYTWMHAVSEDPDYAEYSKKDSEMLCQMWSHGGMDRPTDAINKLNGVSVHGRTPRSLIREILGADFV